MRYSDKWIIALIAIILIACIPFEVHHLEPTGCEVIASKQELPMMLTASPEPTPINQCQSCELEVTQLKDEIRAWQKLYYDHIGDE
jgi:hypothetical protein